MRDVFVGGLRATLLASLGMGMIAGCGGATNGSDETTPLAGAAGRTSTNIGGFGGSSGSVAVSGRGGSDGTSGTGGTSGGSAVGPASCRNPAPRDVAVASGFVECEGGWLHRPTAAACAYSPRDNAVVNRTTEPAECERDADCTAEPFGRCVDFSWVAASYPPSCDYGCGQDSDCEAGMICVCGEPAGRCMPASCTTDGDCGGALCLGVRNADSCGGDGFDQFVFRCQTPGDRCRTGDDCNQARGEVCAEGASGSLQCVTGPVCGRPFLVHGTSRTAEASRTRGWIDPELPDTAQLDFETRRALAEHWTSLGLLEHASVAAFARFSLELLALGAPAELLEATQRALGDEIAHAKLCFGMASAYAAAPIGPSALALDGVLDQRSSFDVIRTAFLEACVGETLAAVEAASLIEHATDPVVRAALERIATDEARHAELGFQFLKWALESAPLTDRLELEAEISRLMELELELEPEYETRGIWVEHGVAPPSLRRHARSVALAEVIVPCVRALFGSARAAA